MKPPYFFGPRPEIKAAPNSVRFSGLIKLRVEVTSSGSAADIDRVVLLRAGAVTHHFDPNQRYIELAYTATDLTPGIAIVEAVAPASNLAPAGFYLLFVIENVSGARQPSEARFLQLTK